MDLRRAQGRKRGHQEEAARGGFWRGTRIAIDSRLRIGCALAKPEEEVTLQLMAQLKERGHPQAPPALATDGKGSYREAMLQTWGQVPEYGGRGRPPTQKQPGPDWHYLQVVKERRGSRLIGSRADRSYLDGSRTFDDAGHSYRYQHAIGRLPLVVFLPNRYTRTGEELLGKNLFGEHAVDYLTRGIRCRKSPSIRWPGRP